MIISKEARITASKFAFNILRSGILSVWRTLYQVGGVLDRGTLWLPLKTFGAWSQLSMREWERVAAIHRPDSKAILLELRRVSS